MRDTAASRNNLLPYPVITAAVQGDPDAVNRVIGHYSGYIAALSTRTSYDPQGCPHSQVDDDLRKPVGRPAPQYKANGYIPVCAEPYGRCAMTSMRRERETPDRKASVAACGR